MDEELVNAFFGSVPVTRLTEKFYESGFEELRISLTQGDHEIRFEVQRNPTVIASG